MASVIQSPPPQPGGGTNGSASSERAKNARMVTLVLAALAGGGTVGGTVTWKSNASVVEILTEVRTNQRAMMPRMDRIERDLHELEEWRAADDQRDASISRAIEDHGQRIRRLEGGVR